MPHAALVAVGKASTHTHKGQGKGGNKQWGDVLKHHEMDTATNDTDTNDTQTATVACFPPHNSINTSTLQTGNAGVVGREGNLCARGHHGCKCWSAWVEGLRHQKHDTHSCHPCTRGCLLEQPPHSHIHGSQASLKRGGTAVLPTRVAGCNLGA